jgi:hypothetical protein
MERKIKPITRELKGISVTKKTLKKLTKIGISDKVINLTLFKSLPLILVQVKWYH